jgi:hypothetical protein
VQSTTLTPATVKAWCWSSRAKPLQQPPHGLRQSRPVCRCAVVHPNRRSMHTSGLRAVQHRAGCTHDRTAGDSRGLAAPCSARMGGTAAAGLRRVLLPTRSRTGGCTPLLSHVSPLCRFLPPGLSHRPLVTTSTLICRVSAVSFHPHTTYRTRALAGLRALCAHRAPNPERRIRHQCSTPANPSAGSPTPKCSLHHRTRHMCHLGGCCEEAL